MAAKKSQNPFLLFLNAALVVSALGYFVDVFDLYLFSIVRNASLKDLGLEGEAVTKAGLFLMNMQMTGMLLGGVFWGVLGDKKGRLSVLFGSILLYSIANLSNAFVHDVTSYAVCRFIAGLGLAGELGAGITLVGESISKEKRSLGTTFVASIGVAGAIVASLTGGLLPWRTTYMIGGFLGLALLIARGTVFESELFNKAKTSSDLKRGQFFALFTSFKRFRYYIACILMGVPTWYVAGVLMTLSPEIGKQMGIVEPIKAASAVLSYGVMLTAGDVISGLTSHFLKSRKIILTAALVGLGATLAWFFVYPPATAMCFYMMFGAMGFFIGTWCVLVTMASELFGTNLRNTVTSTVPNFIRGSTIIVNMGVTALAFTGLLNSVEIIGAIVIGLAIISALSLPETYHRDLDFNEVV